MQSFEDRWADPRFEDQATAFLSKFVGPNDEPIKPALLCRAGKQLDGQEPSDEEVRALELSLVFAFVDRNPRTHPKNHHEGWEIVTADNPQLYVWPIDLEHGYIGLSTGYLLLMNIVGYKISDELVLRPPLDLHMPIAASSPDPLC